MIYTAKVLDVSQKTVSRKRDGKTITIFEITDSAGRNPATSRRDLANEAHQLRDQMAEIQVRIEQSGAFENVYLEDIKPATNGAARPQEPVQQPQVQQQAQPPQPQPQITQDGSGTQRDWSIWRQTATKVAANLSPQTPGEFWFNVRQLLTFYATGLEPDLPQAQQERVTSYAPAEQAQQAQQFIPDEAIANAPPVDDRYDHTDEDIPF